MKTILMRASLAGLAEPASAPADVFNTVAHSQCAAVPSLRKGSQRVTRKKDNKQTLPGKRRSAMVFEELEPRLLLSADLPIDLPAVLAPDRGEDEPIAVHEEITTTAVTGEQHTAHELVFVDTDTPDYQLLVDDLLGNSSEDRLIEVVLLDNSSDGIAQITDMLSEYNELDAVHIISHGSEGSIDLGGTQLEFDTLLANTTAIQGWAEAFSENGDLLIYGCNLAASSDGQALVDSLARLTGADVAASDDLTGSAERGGDWELEYNSGLIETSIALSSQFQQEWSSALAVNLAPVNTVPADQITAENTALEFSTTNGNVITVSDADAGGNEIEVTLSVTNGTLSLNLGTQPIGDETPSNTETANAQISPDIAYAADGSYAVVWTSELQDGDKEGIYYQRYDANGNAIGGEVQVNTTTLEIQESPKIAMDDAGNSVVVWESFGQDKNNTWGVIGQRFDAAGNKVGSEFVVNTTVNFDQSRHDVAMDSAGNFIVAWTHNSNEDTRIQRFAADGSLVGVETTVSTWSGIKVNPTVAMDDAGNAVIVWYTNSQDGSSFGITGQRVDCCQ